MNLSKKEMLELGLEVPSRSVYFSTCSTEESENKILRAAEYFWQACTCLRVKGRIIYSQVSAPDL